MTTGECAQGHNSAIVDEAGDAFVVYHTRFNNGTEGHQVRFRQLFVNENGWLVASPFRFTGKQTRQADIDSRRLFTADEVAGVYNLLIHPYRLNHSAMAEATPVKVALAADGTISGDRTGTWSFTQEGQVVCRPQHRRRYLSWRGPQSECRRIYRHGCGVLHGGKRRRCTRMAL